MIHLKEVSKRYGSAFAVKDVSLKVKKSDRLVLLGTSGSGKTTLLRMINRLIEPSSGTVEIDGISFQKENNSDFRRNFGYVIQNHGLFPHYTVAENIAVIPKLLHWKKEAIQKRTKELMVKFHLDHQQLENAYPSELSGGQKQRVGLARALAGRAPILLMDEPFGALDRVTRLSIRKELLQNDELRDKTVVMVTHDVEEAIAYGDQICLMDKGHIQQLGTASELLFRPENNFTRQFFDFNRTELEWKAVPIKSVWKEISSSFPHPAEPWESWLNLNESMWTALAFYLNKGDKKALAILNDVFMLFKEQSQ